jgi:hypothetical protein
VGNRVTLEFDRDEALPRTLGTLADGVRYFVGLAIAHADTALLIAGDDERREAEAASALHDLGATVHVDYFFRKLGLLTVAVAKARRRTGVSVSRGCHMP